MTFLDLLKRRLFRRTFANIEAATERAYYRAQQEKLLDAIVRSRGEAPVFEAPPPTTTTTRIQSDPLVDNLLEDGMLREDQRIIDEAVYDEEAFMNLMEAAADDKPRARGLLLEVERRQVELRQMDTAEDEAVM